MKSKSPNVKLLVLTATANNSRSDKKRCAALMSSFPDFSEVSSSFLFLLLLRFAVRQDSYSRTPAEASIQGVYFRREAEGLETCLHSGRGGRPRKLFPGRLRLLYKASIIPGARRKASKLVVSSFRARAQAAGPIPGARRKASKLVSSFRARAAGLQTSFFPFFRERWRKASRLAFISSNNVLRNNAAQGFASSASGGQKQVLGGGQSPLPPCDVPGRP